MENAAHLGLPIPAKLKEILIQLHNRDENETVTQNLQDGFANIQPVATEKEPIPDQSGEEHLPEASE